MKTLRRAAALVPGIAFVGVLALPVVQSVFGLAPTIGLGGAVAVDPPVAPRTLRAWHDGALQTEIEAALVKHLGLRDWMVRLDNEMKFALFGVTKRPVVGGPGGWLYEDDYLTARGHVTGPWGAAILERCHKLWQAQQVLAEHGVTLVLVLTPSKVETYPEHLPFPHANVHAAGHPHCLQLMQAIFETGLLNHVDAQKLFTEWRRQDPDDPLFHRLGTHWTHPGAARVVVRLLDHLEAISGIDLVNVDVRSIDPRRVPADHDLLDLANLWERAGRREAAGQVGAAVLEPRAGDLGKPQGILLVATSFGWLLLENLNDPRVSDPMTFHYYFRTAYDVRERRLGAKRDVDRSPAALRAEILRHRFVVLEWNAAKFLNVFGFPEAVLEAFGLPKETLPAFTAEQTAAIQRAMTERRPIK